MIGSHLVKKERLQQQQNIPLVCQRCGNSWLYKGCNPYFAICTFCKTTVQVRSQQTKDYDMTTSTKRQQSKIDDGGAE